MRKPEKYWKSGPAKSGTGKRVSPAMSGLRQIIFQRSSNASRAVYSPCKRHGMMPLIAIAASHHRLMWVHPFLDGTEPGYRPLKSEAAFMLQEVLCRGEIRRGGIIRVSGMAERTGRALLRQLTDERLLISDSPKGAVRLNLPTHFAGHLFPNLYPEQ